MGRLSRLNRPAGILDSSGGAALPAGRSGSKYFNPERDTYNLTGSSMRKFRNALAAAQKGTAPCRINFYGDSITVGFPTSGVDNWTTAPAELLRTRLATKYGNTGTGLVFMNPGAADSRLGTSGSWSAVTAGYGAFGTMTQFSSSNTAFKTFTPTVSVDAFSFWLWVPSGAASVEVSIDGAVSSTIDVVAAPTTPGGSGAGTTGVIKRFSVAAGALGAHTLKLRVATGTIYLWAVEGTVGAAGVRVTRLGKGGSYAGDLAVSNPSTAGGSMAAAFDMAPPHLSIIGFGHNEYLFGVSSATYQTNMQALITRAQATGSVILATQIPNQSTANTPSQAVFDQILYSLADANDVAVIDLASRWGAYGLNSAAMYADGTHPSDQGKADMASAYWDALPLGL